MSGKQKERKAVMFDNLCDCNFMGHENFSIIGDMEKEILQLIIVRQNYIEIREREKLNYASFSQNDKPLQH